MIQFDRMTEEAGVCYAPAELPTTLSDEEFEAFERDYQSLAGRPLEGTRLRAARRYALEQLLARLS